MPTYFYHLKLELYSYPAGAVRHQNPGEKPTIFLPPRTFNIFANPLPAHQPSRPRNRRSYQGSTTGNISRTKGTFTSHSNIWGEQGGRKNEDNISSEGPRSREEQVNREAAQDWRYDRIAIESIDMANTIGQRTTAQASELTTRGTFVALNPKNTEVGWGVIHLYREGKETPALADDVESSPGSDNGQPCGDARSTSFDEESCTTLCILAVPSYMTPSDLLGFLGEQTKEQVSHFRLIRSAKSNKYMVLMKFREAKAAKLWRKAWNGKHFNSMDAETCHVVFVKSIEFQTPETDQNQASFPDMTNDPFTPAARLQPAALLPTNASSSTETPTSTSSALSTKPFAPPPQSLLELPTCPVCLERMDETTGLLTIVCQHVFHCACLEKWRGSGCPVCRYTQNDIMTGLRGYPLPGETPDNECSVCGTTANLWICLICGNVGCGRYDSAHAYAHYEATSHCYAMDVATQHVWDYAGDGYVHRLIQNKTDGKLVELPAAMSSMNVSTNPNSAYTALGVDSISREKFENMSTEYTYLLTSQLDSQRTYFEEQLERAVDKASKASASAEKATKDAESATRQLNNMQKSFEESQATIFEMSKQLEKVEKRATRFEKMSRDMGTQLKEEKTINESLMTRIKFLDTKVEELDKTNKDLEEQNRDMGFFISGQAKLKELEEGGEEGVAEGDVSLPEVKKPGQGKKKKGKGKANA
ncbi:MAG: hypothetical protein M1820_000319 [Bogoriella megaspora]|nr:MAG: hypothetical protein M1820_000319 [Bogoriella megaspora]